MRQLLFILLLLLAPVSAIQPLMAQTQEQTSYDILEQASQLYEIGQFDECQQLLTRHEHAFTGSQRVSVYRMLCLISIYNDNKDESERYAGLLLRQDPFYTAYDENPRFRDMIERLKKGDSTISTASQQSETLEEAPVPVTLITRQMIEMSGARTLLELLSLYVPGVSVIEGMNSNFAMRGVYSQSQESVLIMLDGHRLNSQSSNAESPDYRTSLDKIQQIEVLRGPASSLYGNVALTAVVNIITRSGSEVDGSSFSFTAGQNRSIGGTYMFGKGNLSQNILAWASFYGSKGEAVDHESTCAYLGFQLDPFEIEAANEDYGHDTRYIGGYNGKPAYDFGLRCRWEDYSFLFTAQQSKRTPFYNQVQSSDNYRYDDYSSYRGSTPGYLSTQYIAAVDYNHSFDNLTLKLSGYGMIEESQLYNVLADSLNQYIGGVLDLMLTGQKDILRNALSGEDLISFATYITEANISTKGVWQSLDYNSKTFGGSAQIGYDYQLGKQYGNLLAGVQYDYFSMPEGTFVLGSNYSTVKNIAVNSISQSDEQTFSSFIQIKHNFTDNLIFNGGIRYDRKSRINHETLNSFSPRLTLIWQPMSYLTTKFSYAHSFVDAPYIYRASKISLYQGKDLKAENMDAFQLTTIAHFPQRNLRFEGNLFYNHVKDFVYMDPMNIVNGGVIVNSGTINMLGLEGIAEYTHSRALVNANFTLQKPLSVDGYPAVHGHVCNVPNTLANLTAAYTLFDNERYGTFWLRGNMHFQTEIYMLHMDVLQSLANYYLVHSSAVNEDSLYPNSHQAEVFTANMGADWKWHNVKLSLDIYNLFNKKYEAGGMIYGPVPQMSRHFMAKINIKL